MPPPSRRAYLATAATSLATLVAGCARTDGSPVESTTPSSAQTTSPATTTANGSTVLEPGERFTTDGGVSLRIGGPAVHRSVTTTEQVSHHTYEVVEYPPTGQYLVVRVGTTGTRTAPVDLPLSVVADGDSRVERGRMHVGGQESSRVGFHLPRMDVDDVGIVWDAGESRPLWKLEAVDVEKLSAVPEFSVESWDVPTSVERGSTFEVSVTVENTGDRDGRFLATFDADIGSLPLDEVSTTVQAGKTKTATFLLRPRTYSGIDEFPVVLDWGAGRRTQSVSVTDS